MATKGKPPTQAPSQAKGKAKPAPQITPGQIESLQAALKRKEAKTRGEILDRIVEALRIGANPDAAAAYAGISRSTYYNWRKDDPVFAEECEQAIAAAEVQLLMDLRHHGRPRRGSSSAAGRTGGAERAGQRLGKMAPRSCSHGAMRIWSHRCSRPRPKRQAPDGDQADPRA
jgi:hypothetical protein